MNLFLRFVCLIGRVVLSLRYQLTIVGREALTKANLNKKGGTLFLPNHPAHLDPIFVTMHLWPKFKMRPLAIEYVYRQTFIHAFMKMIKAIPIPSFETSVNEIKMKKAEESLAEIVKGLHKKQSFLLYPGGRLKHTAKEILGGASAAHSILEECPDTNIVLIRTTGLWGSSFSRAIEHRSPDIKKTVWKGIKILFKNAIFFAPRRKVLIEIEPNPQDLPIGKPRLEFNRYLENWYNRYPKDGQIVDEEPLTLVSYSFWHKVYPHIQGERKKKRSDTLSHIPQQKKDSIFQELATISKHPISDIHEDKNLALDLGLDSLDVAQIVAFLSDRYEVGEMHPEDLETVRDVLEFSGGQKKTMREHKETSAVSWPEEKNRYTPECPAGKTIQEAFLRVCERMGNLSACADDLIGVLSYRKLKIAVLVLAEEFKKLPGKNIAIMLPASAGAYIVILACMMAGKIPVMLNWTLGPKYLNDTMNLTKSKVVISSWKFLERLAYVEFGDLTGKVKLMEDIKQKINIFKKIKGMILSYKGYAQILQTLHLDHVKEDDVAGILFTSGTEAAPKGVPLTHKNLLSNQYAGMQCVAFSNEDVLFGILPPFHSFGFSVAGLFPILAGIKVAFSPDPTDSFALAKGIVRWGVTIFCSAPSFLKGLLHAATKAQLSTLRLVISGAEKAPAELYEKVRALGKNKIMIEGYGITECSPIISLNRLNLPNVGVGQLLPGIQFCTIHPESHELLKEYEEGEICIRGPNVFHGYLGDVKSPFIEIHGKSWYRTGDLGYLDKRGNLILSGRLKRFAKIGGEMVSLGAIEGVLAEALAHKEKEEDKPYLALCVNEKDSTKSSLILFTTLLIDKTEVNDILKNAGYSRLVKITDVKKLTEIPLTGTGKTDYRRLQTMV